MNRTSQVAGQQQQQLEMEKEKELKLRQTRHLKRESVACFPYVQLIACSAQLDKSDRSSTRSSLSSYSSSSSGASSQASSSCCSQASSSSAKSAKSSAKCACNWQRPCCYCSCREIVQVKPQHACKMAGKNNAQPQDDNSDSIKIVFVGNTSSKATNSCHSSCLASEVLKKKEFFKRDEERCRNSTHFGDREPTKQASSARALKLRANEQVEAAEQLPLQADHEPSCKLYRQHAKQSNFNRIQSLEEKNQANGKFCAQVIGANNRQPDKAARKCCLNSFSKLTREGGESKRSDLVCASAAPIISRDKPPADNNNGEKRLSCDVDEHYNGVAASHQEEAHHKLASLLCKDQEEEEDEELRTSEEEESIYLQVPKGDVSSRHFKRCSVARSGSQCSSLSSSSSSCSSAGSAYSAASSFALSCAIRTSNARKEMKILEENQSALQDENNNSSDYRNAYADSEATSAPAPAPAPPPPPPPPPPPLPSGPLPAIKLEPIVLKPVSAAEPTIKPKRLLASNSAQATAIPTFIPPQFSAPPADGANIKPSEYLKRMASNSALSTATSLSSNQSGKFEKRAQCSVGGRFKARGSTTRPFGQLNRSQSTSALASNMDNYSANLELDSNYSSDTMQSTEDLSGLSENAGANLMNAIKNFDKSKSLKSNADAEEGKETTSNKEEETQKERTNKQVLLALDLMAVTKRDLIAELKESKGLDGIKRMQESCRNSKADVQQIVASMVPSFKADDFLDKVSQSEPNAPLWKKQMLAKKAAERARKECEENVKKELERRRLGQIPIWKRQMMEAKKKANERLKQGSGEQNGSKVDEEAPDQTSAHMWRRKLSRKQIQMTGSMGNVNTLFCNE